MFNRAVETFTFRRRIRGHRSYRPLWINRRYLRTTLCGTQITRFSATTPTCCYATAAETLNRQQSYLAKSTILGF